MNPTPGQEPVVRDFECVDLDSLTLRIYCADTLTLPSKSEVVIPAKVGKNSSYVKSQLEGQTCSIRARRYKNSRRVHS